MSLSKIKSLLSFFYTSKAKYILWGVPTLTFLSVGYTNCSSGFSTANYLVGASSTPALAAGGKGSSGHLTKWLDSANLTNSVLFESSEGNIGLGTTNPTAALHLSKNSTGSGVLIDHFGPDNNPYLIFREARGTMSTPLATQNGDSLGGIYARGYGSTGWIGNSGLFIFSTDDYSDSGGGAKIEFWTNPNGSLNSQFRMIIDQGGNVGVGVANPGTKLQVAGVISPSVDNAYTLGDATHRFSDVYSVNAANNTSDSREKKQIIDSDLGLDFIRKLRPVSYFWKSGVDETQHYGLIAQETEQAIADSKNQAADIQKPIIVTYDKENDRYGLRYTELISPIIKAIQELSAKVLKLETENATLRAQAEKAEQENAAIKARLDKIEKMLISK